MLSRSEERLIANHFPELLEGDIENYDIAEHVDKYLTNCKHGQEVLRNTLHVLIDRVKQAELKNQQYESMAIVQLRNAWARVCEKRGLKRIQDAEQK